MMSISAGMYEVTSRPTSCSRTAGFDQTFMTSSYSARCRPKLDGPAEGPPTEAIAFSRVASVPRIQITQVQTAMAAINHRGLANGSKPLSQTRVLHVISRLFARLLMGSLVSFWSALDGAPSRPGKMCRVDRTWGGWTGAATDVPTSRQSRDKGPAIWLRVAMTCPIFVFAGNVLLIFRLRCPGNRKIYFDKL